MNEYNNFKNESIDDILGDIGVHETNANIVKKVVGGEQLDDVLLDNGYQVDLSEEYPMIPVDWIRTRSINEYSMTGIPALMDNIRKIGLINPIILVADAGNDGKRYTISDGERRFTAYSNLLAKAREENNAEDIDKFSMIKCRILTKEELKYEEAIHRSANDMARDNTLYERIYRYHPSDNYFDDVNRQKEYIEMQYGDGAWDKYLNGELKVKFNRSSLAKYIYLLMRRDYPSVEVSGNTVRSYVSSLLDSCDELKKQVMANKVSPRESIRISAFDKDIQENIVSMILNGTKCDDAINEIKSNDVKEAIVQQDEETELTDLEYMNKVCNLMIKDLEKFKRLEELSTKGFTGNEKDRFKQMKSIMKQYKKLSELPK